jgi:hypothetical protein
VNLTLSILDGLPDVENVATRTAMRAFFIAPSAKSQRPALSPHRKSLNALLRSEKILLAQDEVSDAKREPGQAGALLHA